MQIYRVTKTNRRAVWGLIKKFLESCERKKHVYKFNRTFVFPYLTNEQIKNASFAFPANRTCKFNGLRGGETVYLYGGNKIVVKGEHNQPLAEFVRIVPSDESVVDKFIESLSHPMPTIPDEFIHKHLMITNNKKRYATRLPFKH